MRSFALSLAIAFSVALIASWFIFVGLAHLSGSHIGVVPRGSDIPADRVYDLTRTTVAAAGLLAGVFAIVYAYRKQRIEEAAGRRADSDSIGKRYQEAASQLGHEKAPVRLAGVYALSRLADDDDSQREMISRLLCAYIRMPYDPNNAPPGEREVRLSVIKVIADHLFDPSSPASWCGYDLDFSGATFDGGSFSGAKFTSGNVSFSGCKFVDGLIDFGNAEFSGADVDFGNGDSVPASFYGGCVSFVGANFSAGYLSFIMANFAGGEMSFGAAKFLDGCSVSFSACTLSAGHISFGGPVWRGAEFIGGRITFAVARLNGGLLSFIGSEFRGARLNFKATDLAGTAVLFDESTISAGVIDFGGAKLQFGEISFKGAELNPGIVSPWPLRFSPSLSERSLRRVGKVRRKRKK